MQAVALGRHCLQNIMRILRAMDPEMGGDTGTEEAMPETEDSDDQSFFLPSSFPGRADYKSGDTITLKVIGEDADGDLEVKCLHPKGDKKDMMTDLRESVPNSPGPY